MKCRPACPVACPVGWTATSEICSPDGRCLALVPTTLLTCPSVSSYRWHRAACGDSHLSEPLSDHALAQRGGTFACPFAQRSFIRAPRPLLPSPPPLPANVGGNRFQLRRGCDGGAR